MTKKLNSIFRGASGVFLSLAVITAFTLSIATSNAYRGQIDKFFGTTSSIMKVDENNVIYPFESEYSNPEQLVKAHEELGERLGAEGCVLLKNNNEALPLSKTNVTLFGMRSHLPQYGGDVGAVVAMNDSQGITLEDALKNNGFNVNPNLINFYKGLEKKYRPGGAGRFTNTINEVPLTEYSNFQTSTYDGYGDAAIVVLGRICSETKDYLPGSAGIANKNEFSKSETGNILGLSNDELDLLDYVINLKKQNVFGKVIVLINATNAMELGPIKNNSDIDGLMIVGVPGSYGFNGIAKVLNGTVSPSGKLVDTYAVNAALSPAAQNYGNYIYSNFSEISPTDSYNGNTYLVENESIYDGYKYYETRYADAILNPESGAASEVGSSSGNWNYDSEVCYPFGYGLSYTSFSQSLDEVNIDWENGKGYANVTVTNNGLVDGKFTVQLYVSTPYENSALEKSAIQLIGFAKTGDFEEEKNKLGNSLDDAIYLAPGEKETVKIEFDVLDFASYDETLQHDNLKGGYVLDKGTYYFSIGESVHDALINVIDSIKDEKLNNNHVAYVQLEQKKEITTTETGALISNQLQDMDLNYWLGENTVTYLSRKHWDSTFPNKVTSIAASDAMIKKLKNNTYIMKSGETSDFIFGENGKIGKTRAIDLIGVKNFNDPIFDELLSEIPFATMISEIANGGTSLAAIPEIASPEFTETDGPAGLIVTLGQASVTGRTHGKYAVSKDDKYGNYSLNTFPTEPLIASTFSHRLANLLGCLVGNDTIWSGYSFWFAPALNTHRTPFNGRNNEYFSEDPVLSGDMAVEIIKGAQNYGAAATPKHLAFNDQETNRAGVSVFMTEQKAREGELTSFRKAIVDGQAKCLMGSYNRVGVTFSSAHYGLVTGIVRNEWGFNGLITTDMVSNSNYQTAKESIMAGTDWMLQNGSEDKDGGKWYYMQEKYILQDAAMTRRIRESFHHVLYAIANTNIFNGMSKNSEVIRVYPWWEITLIVSESLFGLLTIGTFTASLLLDISKQRKVKSDDQKHIQKA